MLNARHLKLNLNNRIILDDISLSILAKERIALVGKNGAGKSSLLRILAGDPPDFGQVEMSKQTRIGFLKQIPDLDTNLSVVETVRQGIAHHLQEINEHQNLCNDLAQLSDDIDKEKLIQKIDKLALRIENQGGFDVDYWVESVLSRLGIVAREQKIQSLSGGERRRVDLARILLSAPDIYLLDEPTNHLDISAIEFLVETFTKTGSTLLFVSHDSKFIDEIATKIVELAHGKIFTHTPPFANYLENTLVRELIEERSLHRQERLIVNELVWLRAGTPARTTKQNARIDRAYELIDQVAKDHEQKNNKRLDIEITKPKRLGKTIVELSHVGAQINDRILFQDFSLKVTAGQRYGILGPNGAGKTTLLAILANKIPPSFGQVVFGKNTETIQFDQQRDQLDPNKTLKETLADHGDFVRVLNRDIHIASYLEKYLFRPSDAHRRVDTLSGGEQNRLLLAKLFRHDANCLLLDEVTNDLDVISIAVLEEVLLEFQGVVFLVSHDRNFLDRVSTSIIVFEKNPEGLPSESSLMVYAGNYSDYQRLKERSKKEIIEKQPARSEDKKPERPRPKKRRSFNEEREFQEMENSIDVLEKERSALFSEVASADFYKNDPLINQQKIERLHWLDKEIERLYLRWQQLADFGN